MTTYSTEIKSKNDAFRLQNAINSTKFAIKTNKVERAFDEEFDRINIGWKHALLSKSTANAEVNYLKCEGKMFPLSIEQYNELAVLCIIPEKIKM